MKQNNDAAFAVRREQDKTNEVIKEKKSLEGNMAELNTQLRRMEDSNQAVSQKTRTFLLLMKPFRCKHK